MGTLGGSPPAPVWRPSSHLAQGIEHGAGRIEIGTTNFKHCNDRNFLCDYVILCVYVLKRGIITFIGLSFEELRNLSQTSNHPIIA